MIFNFDDIIIYVTLFFSIFSSLFFLITYVEGDIGHFKKKRVKKYPKISVIIPAYNESKNILSAIKSSLKVNYPRNKLEIIIVDDGSDDDTYRQAKKIQGKTVKVFTKKHSGKAKTVNYGIKKSTGEIIMILDADTFPDKNCFKNIVGYFGDPKIMAALPAIKILRQKNIIEKFQVIEYSIMALLKKTFFFMGSMNCTPAGAFIRKKFIKKYGGFATDTLTEDFEMGLKIQSKNYQVAQSLESHVYTIVPNNLRKLIRQRVRWSYGTLTNISKYRSMLNPKYGDLGLFILPSALFSIGLISFLFLYFSIRIIFDIIHRIYLISLIDFDILPLLNFNKEISVISIATTEKTFFIIFTIIIMSIMYEISRRNIKEKFGIQYVLYLLLYGWIIGFSQLVAIVHFIIRKKPKW